ncbi:MAG TPA: PIN domain-containing protein [Vicinamibacteria bacterium]|nr:PIN domain-containing protein [Vicinamibacteria bacterium]
MRYHLDTDFLVYALSTAGPERRRLRALADSNSEIGMSAVAWYEFARGPRTPEQLAVARALLGEEGVVPFGEAVAAEAAEVFRRLGSPRRRAADVAIGVSASLLAAVLLTRNARDFAGIPGLRTETGAPA